MPANNVIIEFKSDIAGLQPAYDALLKLGKITDDDVAAFNKANAAQKELAASAAKSSTSYDKLASSADNVKKNIIDGSINKAIEGTGKLIDKNTAATKTYDNSIRGLKQQYKDLISDAIKAGETSPIGQEALQRAGELKDRIGDLMQTTKNYASDTATFDAISQGIGTIGAGFQAAQGAQTLFGAGNEDLQKSLVRLQAVMALTNGLQQIQNNLQAESALRLKLASVQQAVYTTVVGTSTGAMKLFRIALAATGIGLLVIGLVALIANFDSVKNAVVGFIEKFDFLKKAINFIVAPIMAVVEAFKKLGQAIGFLDGEDVNAAERSIERLGTLITKLELYAKKKIALMKSLGEDTRAMQIKYDALEIAAINQQMQAVYFLRQKGELDEKEYNEKIGELRDQLNEKIVETNNINYEIEQRGLQARKNNIDKALFYAKKGSEEEIKLKINAINAQLAIDNSQRDMVAGQRALNNEKAKRDIQLAVEESTAIRLQGEIDFQNKRLLSVQKGGADELAIRRNILDIENTLTANNSKLTQTQKKAAIIANGQKELELIRQYGDAQITLAEQIEAKKQTVGNKRLEKYQADLTAELEYYNEVADLEFQSTYQSYNRIEALRKTKFNNNIQLLDSELATVQQKNANILQSEEQLQRDLQNKANADPANRKLYESAILESEDRIKSSEQLTADEIVRINREKNLKIQANDNETEANKKANMLKQVQNFQDLATQSADFLKQLNDTELKQNLDKIQLESDANQQNLDNKIITEGEFARKKKELDDKVQREKVKAAKHERDIQTVMTIVNTASSIIKTGAELGYPIAIPFQVLAGAVGALQLAAINNTKIPEFAKGTEYAPSGWAWVGEKGPELVNLTGGQKIKTASESKSFAQKQFEMDYFSNKTMSGSVDKSPVLSPKGKAATDMFQKEPGLALDYNLLSGLISGGIGSHLSKMPLTQFTMDKNGFSVAVLNGNNKTTFMNDRYSTN